MTDELFTLTEVADRLKVPVSTARKLVVAGTVRGLKVGRRWRVMESDLDAYLGQQRKATTPRATTDITTLPAFPKQRVFGR